MTHTRPESEPEFRGYPELGPLAPEPEKKVTPNGKVEELIQFSITPLVERYTAGMTWLAEVAEEEARVIEELSALWEILRVLPEGQLEPPPGVTEKPVTTTVEYTQGLSHNLLVKGETWLKQRHRSFDAMTLARGIGVHNSSANRLIDTFREEGKIRLSGKRGRAKLWTSTIAHDDAPD